MVKLLTNERLDYVAGTSLKLIQSPHVPSYSIDAVLLSRFVRVPIQKGCILDLCTGNGIIPLVLSTRTIGKIIGVDIQKQLIEMAKRSVRYNHLSEQIQMIEADLNQLPPTIEKGMYDVVTCNPPYFKVGEKKEQNVNNHFAIARHELYCTLEDVIRTCSQYAKHSGKVALVHRPERLTDILTLMRDYRIEPKRLQFVYPKEGKDANIVLIEGVKNGKAGITCLRPITVYEGTHYSETFRSMYEGKGAK